MRSKTVGIRDVARHLNMSIATVSRSLNGYPHTRAETRQKVEDAAEALGYHANHFGRGLRSGSSGSVGFVMQTGPSVTGQGDTFFMGVFDGLQTVLSQRRLDLIALLCPSSEDRDEYLHRVVSRRIVDAIVISNTRRIDNRISFLADQQLPFVALGRSDTDAGHSWLDLDFEDIARRSIDRFVAQGHRRIGIAVPRDLNFSHIFVESAAARLREHGLRLNPRHVFRSLASEAAGYAIARRLVRLEDRPTALAISNEAITTGIYRGLIEAGIHPGSEMAIIGRDSPNTKFLNPRLTCFHLNLHDLGVALGEVLLAAMPAHRSDDQRAVIRRVIPTRLVVGDSDRYSGPF